MTYNLVLAVVALLCTYSTASAATMFTPLVDQEAIEKSAATAEQRGATAYITPLISSKAQEEIVGFFVGIDLVKHREVSCAVVDAKLADIVLLDLNATFNKLSNTEKAWTFVEKLGMPMECVALIAREGESGKLEYDVTTLSPSGDIFWTRNEQFPVVRWEDVNATPFQYTSLWFLGELWVTGIKE